MAGVAQPFQVMNLDDIMQITAKGNLNGTSRISVSINGHVGLLATDKTVAEQKGLNWLAEWL